MAKMNSRALVLNFFVFIIFLSFFSPFSSLASGADIELFYFYETGCLSCEELEEFLETRIELNYSVTIKKYEIHDPDNANLMLGLAEAYNADEIIKRGTPAIFIGDRAFQGSDQLVMSGIEEAIKELIDSEVKPVVDISVQQKGQHKGEGIKKQLTLTAVIGASAIDSINPCAFGVLTLLLSTMLAISKARNRKQVIGAGLAFTAATFICYLLMGFGLFSAIRFAGLQRYIYIAAGILAILVGLWNTKDYFWYERGANIEVPKSWRPYLKRVTTGIVSVPSAFFIGCLVSFLLLPCTSGPYVVIIGMLSDTATKIQGVGLLIIYNFIFVLPFIVITLCVAFGLTSPGKVEKWRQGWLERLHLATGIFMLLLGGTLITLLIFGII